MSDSQGRYMVGVDVDGTHGHVWASAGRHRSL